QLLIELLNGPPLGIFGLFPRQLKLIKLLLAFWHCGIVPSYIKVDGAAMTQVSRFLAALL
ncbi:MAG TPA: hypothetical protein PKU77_13745, partial [Ferruginibacter sp.]|nr:hypothetical protein [Ferruginibacter sp.]